MRWGGEGDMWWRNSGRARERRYSSPLPTAPLGTLVQQPKIAGEPFASFYSSCRPRSGAGDGEALPVLAVACGGGVRRCACQRLVSAAACRCKPENELCPGERHFT
ncbi:hypothetical protein SKAU_G00203780 [Synaphobranchus kaupii]|uniref:Uncharacterized protein n=1 Tax=Synaphobranchus kaupii TaxID=118154 RepID=A0A9Q1FG13_SYNKA|nr:hypothetical protein SKAU_G00203780 [Synaphobranchus kaupii]